MKIKLKCKECDSEFEIPHWREKTAKFCSLKCSQNSKKGPLNVECIVCKVNFHMKTYQLNKTPRTRGIYCSKSCQHIDLKEKFKGELNHQFGLKGHLNSSFKGKELLKKNNNLIDIRVYAPNHPHKDKDSRVLKHRLIVEENYHLFDKDKFDLINGLYFIKKKYDVHHKDDNHNNNHIDNLMLVTKSEHSSLHNKQKIIKRDKLGRITGVFKLGELSETPEVVNTELSTNLND